MYSYQDDFTAIANHFGLSHFERQQILVYHQRELKKCKGRFQMLQLVKKTDYGMI